MNQPTAQPLFEYDVHVLGIVDTQFEFTGELPKSILDCITVMLWYYTDYTFNVLCDNELKADNFLLIFWIVACVNAVLLFW